MGFNEILMKEKLKNYDDDEGKRKITARLV